MKTQISATIVSDSTNSQEDRLTSLLITFPRILLSEINTHRMLSKNTSSSRAIPFNKMVEAVQNDPFIPIAWQKEHKGMQGSEYFTDLDNDIPSLERGWLSARDNAIESAKYLNRCFENEDGSIEGATKQLCNRLLEPFMWTTMLITGSKEGWDNFFNLRCPKYEYETADKLVYFKSKQEWLTYFKGACPDKEALESYEQEPDLFWLKLNKGQSEIHMMALAECIYYAYNESTPKQLKAGEWHIPYGDSIDNHKFVEFFPYTNARIGIKEHILNGKLKIATARCARVSYTVVGEESKKANYTKDVELHDILVKSGHWSPFEHCARAMSGMEINSFIRGECEFSPISCELYSPKNNRGWCRNFKGFIPYRHIIESEL
jgi:thymidylate synthase ThyX